jgi:hypothetical protein
LAKAYYQLPHQAMIFYRDLSRQANKQQAIRQQEKKQEIPPPYLKPMPESLPGTVENPLHFRRAEEIPLPKAYQDRIDELEKDSKINKEEIRRLQMKREELHKRNKETAEARIKELETNPNASRPQAYYIPPSPQ